MLSTCRRYKNKLHNLNQKSKSEILTAESELELRKLDRNEKFLKKNLDLKSEISAVLELRKFDRVLVVA